MTPRVLAAAQRPNMTLNTIAAEAGVLHPGSPMPCLCELNVQPLIDLAVRLGIEFRAGKRDHVVLARETTLQELLEGSKQYQIPLYQRTYSWETAQLKQCGRTSPSWPRTARTIAN